MFYTKTAFMLMASAFAGGTGFFIVEEKESLMKNSFNFYRSQLLLSAVALPLGVIVGAVCALFGKVLLAVGDFRTLHVLFLLPFLGIAGVVITECYSRFGKDCSKGMSMIYEIDQKMRQEIPLRLVPMVMVSTWATHLFGGSAGREGVAVQIGGTLGCFAGGKIPVKDAKRILMIAGMAAGFGGLFRTPMAAAFFAVEVLASGILAYEAVLPSVAASFTASFVSGQLGLEKFSLALDCDSAADISVFPKLILMGIIFGLTGFVFSFGLHRLKKVFAEKLTNPKIRIFVVGTAVGILSLLILNGRYSGLGTNLISESFSGGIYSWDFVLKLIFTVVTLAAGFYGGEVTPLFSIGASLGFVLAALLGMPTELCAALGYAAVFGSATNTVIAPIFIGAEVFGTDYLTMFFVVCIVSYMCNGNMSIYAMQKKNAFKKTL